MGNAFVDNMSRVFDALVEWNGVLVSLFALLVGLGLWLRARLKRQPLPPAMLYAFIFALWTLWWTFTRTGRPLEALYFSYDHIPVVATLFTSVIFLGALVIRRLTPRVLLVITATSVLFWLLGSRALLDDPFSPLFVWLGAQAALISFSIFLNVMNAGNRFALNVEIVHYFPARGTSVVSTPARTGGCAPGTASPPPTFLPCMDRLLQRGGRTGRLVFRIHGRCRYRFYRHDWVYPILPGEGLVHRVFEAMASIHESIGLRAGHHHPSPQQPRHSHC